MIVYMLASKHVPNEPKDVSIDALVEQNNEQVDDNFINKQPC